MAKKLLALLLIVSMFTVAFAACAKKDGSGDTTTSVQTKEAVEVSLPDEKFNGYDFRVLVRPDCSDCIWRSDMFAEADDETRTGAAVYRRNTWVTDTLDCKLSYSLSSNSNMETDAMTVLFSGEDAYDLLMPHGRSITAYANEGYLLDWENDLPWVNLDKPWWDQGARNTFSINNKLYIMNGDISYLSVGYTFAMFFNKDLMDDLEMTYPYEDVRNMTWTFDKFNSLVRRGAKDLNGDGSITVGDDQFGYSTHEHGASFQVIYSTGSRLIVKDEDDIPYLPGVTELTDEAYSKFYELIDSQYATMYYNKDGDTRVSTKSGQSLFWDTYVNGLTEMGDYEYEFGVLPWPNFNENEEGYSDHVSCYVHEFGVPHTVPDAAKTSAIIEALAYGGYTYVMDEYYEQTLSIQKSRDEESKEMLKIIRNSRAYDLGFFFIALDPLSNMGNLVAQIPGHSPATFFNKYQDMINEKLETMLENYID